MKHRFTKLIAGGAAMLLLFGCQDDNSVFGDGSKGIKIQTELTGTTTRTTADKGTAFADGDAIGVAIAEGENTTPGANPVKYTYSATNSGWTAESSLYWLNTEGTHTLYGYYPYVQGDYAVGTTSATFDLPLSEDNTTIDISTAAAYAAADKIWGSVTTTPTSEAVTIPMAHKMSQVVITLKSGDEDNIDVSNMTVELLPSIAFASTGTFDITTGTVAAATTQTATPETMQLLEATENTFYGLLIPGQTFTEGEPFVRVKTTDEKVNYIYYLSLSGSATTLTATAGRSVRFTLTVTKAGVSGMNVTEEDWNEVTNYQDGSGIETLTGPEVIEGWLVVNTDAGRLMELLADDLLPEEFTADITKMRIIGTMNATDLGTAETTTTGVLKEFINEHGITHLNIQGNATEAVEDAFNGCTTLTHVEFDDAAGTSSYWAKAFRNCTYLQEVIIRGWTDIPQGLFRDCANLVTVALPSATTFRVNSFQCNQLTNLVVGNLTTLLNTRMEANGYPKNVFLTGATMESASDIKSAYSSITNGGANPSPTTYDFASNSVIYTNYSSEAGTTIEDYLNTENYALKYDPSTESGGETGGDTDDEWLSSLTPITVSEPGGLASALSGITATTLYIKGEINSTDFTYLVGTYMSSYKVTELCLNTTGVTTLTSKDEIRFNKDPGTTYLEKLWLMGITTLTEGQFPFQQCKALKELYIPNVTSLGNGIFSAANNTNLQTLVAPSATLAGARNCLCNLSSLQNLVVKGDGSDTSIGLTIKNLYVVTPSKTNLSDYATWGSHTFTNIYGGFSTSIESPSYSDYINSANYSTSYSASTTTTGQE